MHLEPWKLPRHMPVSPRHCRRRREVRNADKTVRYDKITVQRIDGPRLRSSFHRKPAMEPESRKGSCVAAEALPRAPLPAEINSAVDGCRGRHPLSLNSSAPGQLRFPDVGHLGRRQLGQLTVMEVRCGSSPVHAIDQRRHHPDQTTGVYKYYHHLNDPTT